MSGAMTRFQRNRPLPRPGCRCPRPRGKGFTLIEAMVVVAIIALLIAILVPSLLKVRENARRIVCQSNLRQIMQGWHSYLVDSKGHFPRGDLLHIIYGGKLGTADQFDGNPPPAPPRPLNKSLGLPSVPQGPSAADLFWCPSDRGELIGHVREDGVEEFVHARYYDYYGNSFRANRYLIGPRPPLFSQADPCYQVIADALVHLDYSDEDDTVNPPDMPTHSRLLVLGDFGWDASWYGGGSTFEPPQWHGRRSDRPHSYWHDIAFMDGHVAFTEIIRGMHVRPDYTVIPFRALQPAFIECQIPGNF